MNQQALSALIWSVADLLRGDFKQSEYGRVILPFTVLRRLDCVLAPTKAAVLAEYRDKEQAGLLYLVAEKFAHSVDTASIRCARRTVWGARRRPDRDQ